MAKGLKPIDVSGIPELLRIAEEVRATKESRVLRRNGEDLAIVLPLKPPARHAPKRGKGKAAYEAFRAAAGGWRDVDTDQLISDIYRDREASDRPPVDL